MSVLSQHRSHQGGQASQRNPALPVSKRALRAADLPPPLLGSRPNTRNPPPGGRPGSEWQRHPRHRPRVADQSHDRDRRVKKKPPRCDRPTARCSPLLVHASAASAASHGAPPRWMRCGVMSGPKRPRDGCGMRLIIARGACSHTSSAPGRMRSS